MSDADAQGLLRRELENARAELDRVAAAGERATHEARTALHVALERASTAVDFHHEKERAQAAPARTPATLTARTYPMAPGAAAPDAEAALDLPTPHVGVCFSGGGSRSMSLCMGALRGLRKLGLLEKVSHLSCVSGGAWAGTTFTFLPASIDDDTFLGPVAPGPGALTWSGSGPTSLESLSRFAMGYAATRIGFPAALHVALRRHRAGDPAHVAWQRAIGELVLGNFGLGDGSESGSPLRYYTLSPESLKGILRDNPELSESDFVLARPGRPYLIVNSTLFYPPPVGFGRPDPSAPHTESYQLEQTPLFTGVVPAFQGTGEAGTALGGGYVDPFAFGSEAPAAAGGAFTVAAPPLRWALSDMAGTSSAGFVSGALEVAEKVGMAEMAVLDPFYPYWPMGGDGAAAGPAATRYVGDGGNLENTGIMAMLRRRIPSIIVFMNAEKPLAHHGAGGAASHHDVQIDQALPPLFGLQPWRHGVGYAPIPADSTAWYAHLQVFPTDAFPALVQGLYAPNAAGGPAVFRQEGLVTVANARFGIPAGARANVLWLHNAPAKAFTAALDPMVHFAMRAEPGYGSFPNFGTLTQLTLSPRQVNLLAELMYWTVAGEQSIGGFPAGRKLFEQMFS